MPRHFKFLNNEEEALRIQGGLAFLQLADPSIKNVVIRATFVSVYVLNEIDQSWARANLEGALYIVYRSVNPHFRLVIVNQRDPRNLVEDITPLWEVSSEKNYLFFRVPLNSKVDTHPSDPKDRRVAGLWFSDDFERKYVQKAIERLLSIGLSPVIFESYNEKASSRKKSPCPLTEDQEKGPKSVFVKRSANKSQSSSNPYRSNEQSHSIEPKGKVAGEAILNLIGVHRSASSCAAVKKSDSLDSFSNKTSCKKTGATSPSPQESKETLVYSPLSNRTACSSLQSHGDIYCSNNSEEIHDSELRRNLCVQLQLFAKQDSSRVVSLPDSNITNVDATSQKSFVTSTNNNSEWSKTQTNCLFKLFPSTKLICSQDSKDSCKVMTKTATSRLTYSNEPLSNSYGLHCLNCCCPCMRSRSSCSCNALYDNATETQTKNPNLTTRNNYLDSILCEGLQNEYEPTCCCGPSESILSELDQRLFLTLLTRLLRPSLTLSHCATQPCIYREVSNCKQCEHLQTSCHGKNFMNCTNTCCSKPDGHNEHPNRTKPNISNEPTSF
ncbi:uncharacterized protein LOC128884315 [Hylaeus volcanicus]|uniref:uncharacterized protein LOC128884315 n=1 Tax=Hylaeus volcanicus TaxID=313075 RepID=UPI0023B83525|nr:uncharacterized protein LOC128884315 [Hylaeus volcanicus]XP_053993598.1 uncharacterized protein LOC128884315 [Hylaeus volcanicus]